MSSSKSSSNPVHSKMIQAMTAMSNGIPAQLEIIGSSVLQYTFINQGHEWLLSVKTEREDGFIEIGFAGGLDPESCVLSFEGRLRNTGINWRPDKWANSKKKSDSG